MTPARMLGNLFGVLLKLLKFNCGTQVQGTEVGGNTIPRLRSSLELRTPSLGKNTIRMFSLLSRAPHL